MQFHFYLSFIDTSYKYSLERGLLKVPKVNEMLPKIIFLQLFYSNDDGHIATNNLILSDLF